MLSLLARDCGGTFAPGRYLPDSTPCASGDQTICEMSFSWQKGMTSFSGLRQSSEYCGWLETNGTVPGTASARLTCSVDHSLKPIYRALPWRTTSLKARMVSSIGVAVS